MLGEFLTIEPQLNAIGIGDLTAVALAGQIEGGRGGSASVRVVTDLNLGITACGKQEAWGAVIINPELERRTLAHG